MAEQTIDQVIKAEEQAQQIKDDHERKIADLKQEFQEKLDHLKEEAHADVEHFKAEKAKNVREAFDNYKASAKAEKEKEIDQMRTQFAKKEQTMVAYVIEEVNKRYGNS